VIALPCIAPENGGLRFANPPYGLRFAQSEFHTISIEGRLMRDALLQDFVVPICRSEIADGQATLRKLEGTAFFINGDGIYLTAAHVLKSIVAQPAESEVHYGLVVKPIDEPSDSLFAPLGKYEFAPAPFDIGIGAIVFRSRSWFHAYSGQKIEGWRDIATLGYPETALNSHPTDFNIHLRMLKGFIQRPIAADELPIHRPHPNCFELNFAVTAGLSGAPLFIAAGANRQELIGVCTSSYSAEIVDYSELTVEEDGKVLKEKSVKAEQYGIAHSIADLLDWEPEILGGRRCARPLFRLGEWMASFPSSSDHAMIYRT
jgi:hypothetical protein